MAAVDPKDLLRETLLSPTRPLDDFSTAARALGGRRGRL